MTSTKSMGSWEGFGQSNSESQRFFEGVVNQCNNQPDKFLGRGPLFDLLDAFPWLNPESNFAMVDCGKFSISGLQSRQQHANTA